VKVFWYCVHLVFFFLILSHPNTTLYKTFISSSGTSAFRIQFVFFFVVVFTALLLFFLLGFIDPGFLKYPMEETRFIRTSVSAINTQIEDHLEFNAIQWCEKCNIVQVGRPSIDFYLWFCSAHGIPSLYEQNIVADVIVVLLVMESKKNNVLLVYICGKSNRSTRIDHHCSLIGVCIGEKNLSLFIGFLFFQSTEILWAFFLCLNGVPFGSIMKDQVAINIALCIGSMMLGVFFVISFGMLCFHCYLLFTNQTTWEVMKGYKISYLKDFINDERTPFDQGLKMNILLLCCPGREFISWKLPYQELGYQSSH